MLLVVGVVSLSCCFFIAVGVIDAAYWYPDSKGWIGPAMTFWAIGFVTCVPGTYAMRIVWHVWKG